MKKRWISILLLMTMFFTMLPADAMATISNGTSTADGTSVYGADNAAQEKTAFGNPFKDVQSGSWYDDAVQYARVNDFFSGINATTFDPDGPMTRGMFITVLGRMAGVDPAAYTEESIFRDVNGKSYYAPYVSWASKFGITSGAGNGEFKPNSFITREQMAVFFVRYFEAFDVDYDTGANITTEPADLDSVSPWAREMVLKLWKTGLLAGAGDGVNFNPAGKASRAEAATLSMRTDKTVDTWYSEPGVPSGRVRVDLETEKETQMPDPPQYTTWTPNTAGYTVEHYQKALNGQYVQKDTDTLLTGLVGAQTAASTKAYTGFTAQAFSQQTIEADGSTRVAIYYDRNAYDVTFAYDNGNNDITLRVPYGSSIAVPANPAKPGYTFTSWGTGIPATMPAEPMTFTAQWTAQADIPYTVRHVRQALDGTYPTNGDLVATESLTGTVDQPTAATAMPYTGFTAQTIIQETVALDGSTVVEIRYARNGYSVTFDTNGDGAGTMNNETLLYGETKILPYNRYYRIGFTFTGWNTASDGTGTAYADAASVSDLTSEAGRTVTLYAQWTVDPNPDHYLWVNGIRVTSGNAIDVLNDGTAENEPTVSYNPSTRTLTLHGATLNTKHHEENDGVIFASGDLIIELAEGASESIAYETGGYRNCGIYVENGNLTLRGSGSIEAIGGYGFGSSWFSHGICVKDGTLTVTSGTIIAGSQHSPFGTSAIYANNGITISGGTISATSAVSNSYDSLAIESNGPISITGGTVTAISMAALDYPGYGLNGSAISITGGTVTAAGDTSAIDGTMTIAPELIITASVNKDGSSPVDTYIPANIGTYKYIRIETSN